MGKPINVQALPEVQSKLKSELASHVVRQNSVSADDCWLKSTRVCWRNNFRMAVNGYSTRIYQASPTFLPMQPLAGFQFSRI